jgi:serine protease
MTPRITPPYSGRLVVRLAPPVVARLADRAQNTRLADVETIYALAEDFSLHGLQTKLHHYPPNLPSYPAVRSAGTAELLAREAQATDARLPPVRSLIGYFFIDPREQLDAAGTARLLDDLNSISKEEVELVYPEPGFRAPAAWAVIPDPMVTDQGYLDPAPKGIGANTVGVWGTYNGAGIGFVDLESGWNLKHVELPQPQLAPQPILNINDKMDAEHGTGVLGIVLAQSTGKGITGIAPAAKFLGVASWLAKLNPVTAEIADAIHTVYPRMNAGDVLLIEVETSTGYPVEVDETILIAIQTTAGKGIVVVEAAGNGTGNAGRDLDKPLPKPAGRPKPTHSLNRKSGAFIDSYAIMVSACRSTVTTGGGHRRIGYASFGSRIDCYAWGDNVTTAGGAGNQGFVPDFNGTSAASAIIAGAAILVQQMVVRKGKPPLTSTQMRDLLAGQVPGTDVQAPSGPQVIGIMPDLEAIAGSFSSV